MKKNLLSCLVLMLVILVGYAQSSEKTSGSEPVGKDGKPCPGAATVTDKDGNTYNTVQIGKQCWMKENLRTTRYADGTTIPKGSSISSSTSYYYYVNNDATTVSKYGYLYNWPAVMHGARSSKSNPSGVQGICPTGWHVPSDAEWTQLQDYVSSQSEYVCGNIEKNIAKALASTEGWKNYGARITDVRITYVVGNNPSANNATGFSALPAGNYHGDSNDLGRNTSFWSATQNSDYNAYGRLLGFSLAYVYRDDFAKDSGFSVRCVRN